MLGGRQKRKFRAKCRVMPSISAALGDYRQYNMRATTLKAKYLGEKFQCIVNLTGISRGGEYCDAGSEITDPSNDLHWCNIHLSKHDTCGIDRMSTRR